jgi:hypothetical protein
MKRRMSGVSGNPEEGSTVINYNVIEQIEGKRHLDRYKHSRLRIDLLKLGLNPTLSE